MERLSNHSPEVETHEEGGYLSVGVAYFEFVCLGPCSHPSELLLLLLIQPVCLVQLIF